MNKARVLVINRANPEMNYLAAALATQGILLRYVRPYFYQQRAWERMLLYLLGQQRGQETLLRRRLPTTLDTHNTLETAVWQDFAMMLIQRAGRVMPGLHQWSERQAQQLNYHIFDQLAQTGARLASNATHVIATERQGLAAFQSTPGKKIINAPLANAHYMQAFSLEEARRQNQPIPAPPLDAMRIKDEELRLADLVLIGSNFARDTYLQYGVAPEKLCIVPFGADLSLFTPPDESLANGNFQAVFAGQIGYRKGVPDLFSAYRRFRKADTCLILAGALTSQLKYSPGAEADINHVDHLTRPALAELFRQSQVFVFPTIMEGMGMVVVEAMACGLPVITTPNGPGDLVRDGVDGFLVPPHAPEAITEKLEYFYTHPEERARMGANARQRAQLFNWENYTKAALDAIFEGKQTHPGLIKSTQP
jgi:glycosyltransferase involved in cell wall biosynthesis